MYRTLSYFKLSVTKIRGIHGSHVSSTLKIQLVSIRHILVDNTNIFYTTYGKEMLKILKVIVIQKSIQILPIKCWKNDF